MLPLLCGMTKAGGACGVHWGIWDVELCLLTILAVGGDETCTEPDLICNPGVLGGIAGGGPLDVTDPWVCTLIGIEVTTGIAAGRLGAWIFGGSLEGGEVCEGRRAGIVGRLVTGWTGSVWVVITGAIWGMGFCWEACWGLLMIVWSFGLDCWGKWVCWNNIIFN